MSLKYRAGALLVVTIFLFINSFAQETIVEFNGGPNFTTAKLLSVPAVGLPAEAQETGLNGPVNVRVVVYEFAKITSIESISGPGPVCPSVFCPDVVAVQKAASDAAMSAKFLPATRQGKPEQSRSIIDFEFTAKDSNEGLSPAAKETEYFSVASNHGTDGRSAGALNYKAIALPKPGHPPAARAIRARGIVTVEVVIDEDGTMFSAEAISGHPLLRAASKVEACGAKFTPTTLMEKP